MTRGLSPALKIKGRKILKGKLRMIGVSWKLLADLFAPIRLCDHLNILDRLCKWKSRGEEAEKDLDNLFVYLNLMGFDDYGSGLKGSSNRRMAILNRKKVSNSLQCKTVFGINLRRFW